MSSKVELGNQSLRLLNDPAFRQAIVRVEQGIFSRWSAQGLTSEERDVEYYKLQAVLDVKTALAAQVADGKMEAAANEAKARTVATTQGK